MNDEIENEIRDAYNECLGYRNDHDEEMDRDDWNNNEGWIEALEFVINKFTNEEEQ